MRAATAGSFGVASFDDRAVAVMDSVARIDGADQSAPVAGLQWLQEFRGELYRCLGRRRDELFELTDALLCAEGPVSSLVGLCLVPEHRRGTARSTTRSMSGRWTSSGCAGCWRACRCRGCSAGGSCSLSMPRRGCARTPSAVPSGCSATSRAAAGSPMSWFRAGRINWPYQLVAALESGPSSWTAILD